MLKAIVWFNAEDRQRLERLAPVFGSRKAALHEALRRLADEEDRKEAFDAFLKAWDEEDGPLTDEEIAAVATHCGL